jgi:hypothetical protein
MQPDNINAVVLIIIPMLTVLVILWSHKLTNKKFSLLLRLILAIPVGFIAHTVMVLKFIYKCDNTGMNPGWQGVIPPLCMMFVIMFVPRKIIVLGTCLILLVVGYKLCWQYDQLVNKSSYYTFIDEHTGEPAVQGCSGTKGSPIIKAKRL